MTLPPKYKRAYDLAFVLIIGILFPFIWIPAWVIVPALILLTMGRPIFYVQERYGEGGRIFLVYKFRTMANNAELSPATVEDSRVTKLGRILRRSSLDEAPQVINILRGEMSLVGPRPYAIWETESIERELPDFHRRLAARPGIVHLTHARTYGQAISMSNRTKLRYDIFYAEHANPLWDTQLIWTGFLISVRGLLRAVLKR